MDGFLSMSFPDAYSTRTASPFYLLGRSLDKDARFVSFSTRLPLSLSRITTNFFLFTPCHFRVYSLQGWIQQCFFRGVPGESSCEGARPLGGGGGSGAFLAENFEN